MCKYFLWQNIYKQANHIPLVTGSNLAAGAIVLKWNLIKDVIN